VGAITTPSPVLLLVAAFSRYDEALDWGRRRAADAWGSIALASPFFEFRETDYYESSMGPGIKKCFWAWRQPIDPGRLAKLKLESNAWEQEYARLGLHPEPRPLNLDPGYVTQAKLVLASTKDHAHRLYLSDGIFAEVTLSYKHRRWQAHEWTFPDYRRDDYQAFFTQCRDYLRSCQPPRSPSEPPS
jgi:hypothetical protein